MGQLAQPQRPLRREEFERMIAAGLFRDERIELIRGVLVEVSPQKAPHADMIQALNRLLVPALLGKADVRVQLPFAATDDSLPEPDLMLVKPGRYRDAHPQAAFLVIEVADSSLELDRHEKAALYAQALVADYWIVNLVAGVIERHSEPAHGVYARMTTFRAGETISPLAFPEVSLRVDDLF
jgi:Uma2 family endonuclease